MNRMIAGVGVLTLAVVLHARVQETVLPALQPRDLGLAALVGGTLIDGTGARLMQNSVVLINRGRIEKVGTVDSLPVPATYKKVSTEGMTVLPGLWDMHTHLQYSAHADLNHWNATYQPEMEGVIMPAIASQLLMAGITSARDPMAPTDAVLRVKARIARREIPGPTMYVSGPCSNTSRRQGLKAFAGRSPGSLMPAQR